MKERGGIRHPSPCRPAPPAPRQRGVRDQRGMEAVSDAYENENSRRDSHPRA